MRARNMQALTDDTQQRHPGVTIYGVGDAPHRLRISDHNEDDTPGSKAAQTDADNIPEHRAIDVMLGPHFTKAQADAYVADLLADPAALARLIYIIFNGDIWERKNGWERRDQVGDQHTDHVHLSGYAPDDENSAGWPAVTGGTGMYCRAGDKGSLNVETLQRRLVRLGAKKANGAAFTLADVDRTYGADTTAGLKSMIGGAGTNYGPLEVELLDYISHTRFGAGPGPQGKQGEKGEQGEQGPKGDAAVLVPGDTLIIQ